MQQTSISGHPRLANPRQDDEPTLEQGVLALYRAARCAQVLSTGDPLDPGLSRVIITVARLGRVRPSAIAAANHIDFSTVSRHVDALARTGLVAKGPDPDDARACLVELTDAGRDVIDAMLTNRTRAVEPALASWDPAERGQLIRLLVRLAHDLDDRVHDVREVTT